MTAGPIYVYIHDTYGGWRPDSNPRRDINVVAVESHSGRIKISLIKDHDSGIEFDNELPSPSETLDISAVEAEALIKALQDALKG